ncbi:MAG: ATP-dependent helicase, partial [Pseudomonadota bacterium]|nr:ATP-dependent helicase [Pseudomonadota bacterium]
IRAARESREPRPPSPSRGPGREPPRSSDPFFDKPYEPTASAAEPAWEPRAAPVGRGLSPNIKPKKKVAALFGGKIAEPAET